MDQQMGPKWAQNALGFRQNQDLARNIRLFSPNMSPSLEEHKGFLPSVNNSVDRPFTGGVLLVLSSTQYACTQ